MAYSQFELVELYEDGDTVVEVIAAAGKARGTGRTFATEVVRVWSFRSGKRYASARTTTRTRTRSRSTRKTAANDRTPRPGIACTVASASSMNGRQRVREPGLRPG